MNTFDTLGLLLFLGLLFFALYGAYWNYKKRQFRKYYSLESSPRGFLQLDGLQFFARVSSLVISWALISIVLAAPSDQEKESGFVQTQYSTVDEVCFLLDASASMRTEDTSIKVSRFQRAKEIITETIEPIGGINISLIAFSGNPEVIVPPTEDYLYFRILLESVRINEPGETGTNFLALTDLLRKMTLGGQFKKKILFVLLTDGEDTTLTGVSQGVEELIKSAISAISAKFTVVALGKVTGAPIPGVTENQKEVISSMQLPFLEMIADIGSGPLYQENSSPIISIVDGLRSQFALQEVNAAVSEGLFYSKQYPIFPEVASLFFILAALFMPLGREKK